MSGFVLENHHKADIGVDLFRPARAFAIGQIAMWYLVASHLIVETKAGYGNHDK